MAKVRDVMAALERIAPKRFAFSFDKVGLQVGDAEADVRKAVVSLDRSHAAVAYTEALGAQMLVAHHPLLFEPLTRVLADDHVGSTVQRLIRADIAFAAAHTNWDCAKGGINDALAEALGLSDTQPFGTANAVSQIKMHVFAPRDCADRIIDALSAQGAGVIGQYSRCAFMLEGRGTFLGSEDTNPTVGEPGRVEVADEVRIEMLMREEIRDRVVRALRAVHPYEEPAFDLVPLLPHSEQPAGRIGRLARQMTLFEFQEHVERALGSKAVIWGAPDRSVRKLAVVGGAADGEWSAARRAGADVFLTGEVRQHNALEAAESGFAIVAAGHYHTEQPGCAALRDRLLGELPEVEWHLFTPDPGKGGRPL